MCFMSTLGLLAVGIIAQWIFMARLHLRYLDKAWPCNTIKDNKAHSASTNWIASNSDTQASHQNDTMAK